MSCGNFLTLGFLTCNSALPEASQANKKINIRPKVIFAFAPHSVPHVGSAFSISRESDYISPPHYHHPGPSHHLPLTWMCARASCEISLLPPLPNFVSILNILLARGILSNHTSDHVTFFAKEQIRIENPQNSVMALSHSELSLKSQSHYKAQTGLIVAAPTPPSPSLTLALATVLSHTLQSPHWPPCHSLSTGVTIPTQGLFILSYCKDIPQISMGLPTPLPSDLDSNTPSRGIHPWPPLPKIVTPTGSLPPTSSLPFPALLFPLALCYRLYVFVWLVISHPHY